MKKKVRVTARIEQTEFGWIVRLSNGCYSAPYPCRESAQRHVNYVNNEDADNPEYMYIDVEDESENVEKTDVWTDYYARKEAEQKAREERKQKQKAREESNRKSKKADDKFVYVVSCYERGVCGVVYLQGETNLLKITEHYNGGFITTKVKEAKVFKTKAQAQKFIDTLSKCWIVGHLLKDLNVVRKDKKIFE